ncbi:MAG: hypothetical protein U0822_10680 [Anaerolineae bacterium]
MAAAATTPASSFTWPDWARTARIAGAYFDPAMSAADIDSQLDALVAQHVSVVLVDSPWGSAYGASVDDATFSAVKSTVASVVQKAHARGLKIVLYQTGLELISAADRNPGSEHPDWPQRSLSSLPLLFNDISNDQAHWLNAGEWDLWISPCSSFQTLSLARAQDMAATGIDGLWVDEAYLQFAMGDHDELWPSSDSCSASAFHADTGLSIPTAENWDDVTFQHWVVWRHHQIRDFLLTEKAAVRSINPDLVFLEENSGVDTARPTQYANDPTTYLPIADMTTGHEVETIADRMDEGETGMQNATLDQWLSFRTMIAFARAADRGKPSWILTYGYQPRDSSLLAGMVLGEGANFYETKGPQMADTVGGAFRTQLFGWVTTHTPELYGSDSAAAVGLLYGPRTRDLVDTGSGEPYDVADSIHFAAYRAAANGLYRAHIPFDVVLDSDPEAFSRYSVLIVPEVQAISDATASALRAFHGRLLTVGDTGRYDDWLGDRSENALAGVPQQHFAAVGPDLITAADTGQLATDAPASVQVALRRIPGGGYAIVLVNTAGTPTPAFHVDITKSGTLFTRVHLSAPDGTELDVAQSLLPDGKSVRLEIPAGVETTALVTAVDPLATSTPSPTSATSATPTPTGTPSATATPLPTPIGEPPNRLYLPLILAPH